MDVAAVAGASTALAQASLQTQMGAAVLKDSLNAEQAVALELLQALAAPQPAHLGSLIDLTA